MDSGRVYKYKQLLLGGELEEGQPTGYFLPTFEIFSVVHISVHVLYIQTDG